MKYKHSLAALAVASVITSQAMAYTGPEIAALEALAPATGTWVIGNWPNALDGTSITGTAWGVANDADPCNWHGIACTASEITNLEVPNSSMAQSMTAILTALDPMKGTLKTLNISSTGVGSNNTGSGAIPVAISGFTSLTHLAVNSTGGTGEIADTTALSALLVMNVNDNTYTSFGGQVGGGALTTLQMQNNTDLTGDLTASLAASANTLTILDTSDTKLSGALPSFSAGVLTAFRADGSQLNGDLILPAATTSGGFSAADWNMVATGVVPDATAAAYLTDAASYDAAQALLAPSAATAIQNTAKDGLDLTWTAAATGATPANYTVGYKLSSASVWTESTEAGTSKSVSPLDPGAYDVRVAANTATAMSAYTTATATIDAPAPLSCTAPQVPNTAGTACVDPVVTPPTCTAPQVLNTAQTACVDPTPVSSGGGGAALWLVMLPLMGLFRRKSA